ncbi:MAG: LysR family transcriptional regulator [Desulfuromonadaceae bacterium]|nr:LysR family transcriptional regulator [Desulfuromonadaceae bacterium]MDD2855363.1 LysR family transcriptional regulator [Desulfuromonadaceae bacterium]
MRTEYLKTLQVISQVGSFSLAATEMFVTQSAISQRIKFLEEHYNCQLLDRSGPTLVLTEAGKIVVRRAEQILKIEAKLINDLRHHGGKSRLSICCTPTFGVAYLPHVINQFMLRHADNIDLKFMFHSIDQAIKELLENEFDLAVIEHTEQLEIPGFEAVQLPKDELIFVSSPVLGIPENEVDIKQLFGQCLIARKIGCASRKLLERNLALGGNKIEDFSRSIVLDDLRMTLETIVSGGGVAFISRSMAVKQLKSGALREHRIPGFTHLRHRTAVINRDRMNDVAIKDFISCILASFDLNHSYLPMSSDTVYPPTDQCLYEGASI